MRLTTTSPRVTHTRHTTAQSMCLTTQRSTSWSLRRNQRHDPPDATVPVSGVGAVGRGASMVAAPLISRPAGGRALFVMASRVTAGAG